MHAVGYKVLFRANQTTVALNYTAEYSIMSIQLKILIRY